MALAHARHEVEPAALPPWRWAMAATTTPSHATNVHLRRRREAVVGGCGGRHDPGSSIHDQLPGGTMRTRPASIATIVIAIGLALTALGIAHRLPYTFGGHGDASTIAADVWAHGTAISPSLVALVFVALLAAIAMRPTRGGRRAAAWLVVLAVAISLSGLAEPAQQQAILFGTIDVVTPFVYALQIGLIALALSAFGETRRTGEPTKTDESNKKPAVTPAFAGAPAAA